jgi:hypothetical protein
MLSIKIAVLTQSCHAMAMLMLSKTSPQAKDEVNKRRTQQPIVRAQRKFGFRSFAFAAYLYLLKEVRRVLLLLLLLPLLLKQLRR